MSDIPAKSFENKGIPSGYQEVSHGLTAQIGPEQIPWLEGQRQITLARFVPQGGREFYLGHAVSGKKLLRAAEKLGPYRSSLIDNMFYASLPQYTETGFSPAVRSIVNPVGDRRINYFANPGGQRVYFIRMDDLLGPENKTPVIVKVAVCDKTDQLDVLTTITEGNRTFMKKRSGI
jgi:dipeptidyl aminopeptidase/acylaminoacyl peptidase